MSRCPWCDCHADISTAWGEKYCRFHYENGPTFVVCPICDSFTFAEDSPVPPGVESDGIAPVADFPTATGATIARVGVPPATPARAPEVAL